MGYSSDRNMLMGILALQMDFINREQLLSAMNAWVLRKTTPLEEILLELEALTHDTVALLQALVTKHLELHGNNAQQSLQAISSIGPLRDELKSLADPDIEATLTVVGGSANSNSDNQSTLPHQYIKQDASKRFRVIRPHAKGGLGEVFLARDTELNRDVALKEIQERFAKDEDSRTRFILEAEVTGGLEHPGIVPVYGLGQYADGRPFYAMRFIKGDSLKDAVDRFHTKHHGAKDFTTGDIGVEFRQLLGRLIDVCQAIEYAHSRGILHRDLKPGNIMLGKYGETLVVDWGLAKVVGRAEQHQSSGETTLSPDVGSGSAPTQMGSAIGTPTYMSPEQASGRISELGVASDVYSLGATLYSLLTGVPPFSGNGTEEILAKVRRGDFPGPRERNPNIPIALQAICLKAMGLKPADRYNSPRKLADDLEKWLADEPIHAIRDTSVDKAARWVRKHRSAAMYGAAALGIVAIVASVSAFWINVERRVAIRQTQLAEQNLYAADMNLAQSAWEDSNVSQTVRLLAKYLPESEDGSHDLRGFEWFYWNELCHSDLQTVDLKNEIPAALSPDGKLIASISNGVSLKVLDAADGQEIVSLKGHSQGIKGVTFSPEGRRLASASWDYTIKTWDLTTGEETHTLQGHEGVVECVAFSPDGQRLASASYDETIKVWDLATGRETLSLKGIALEEGSRTVAYSPDGTRLASASSDHTVKIWDATSGQEILTLNGDQQGVVCIAFNHDGTHLATASIDSSVKIWDARNGQEQHAFRGHTGQVCRVAFSPDGKRLASASDDGSVQVWDALNGQETLILRGLAGFISFVEFSPDGKHVLAASSDGKFKTWDALYGQQTLTLSVSETGATSVAFSPDGMLLASGGIDRTKIWDSQSGQEKLELNLENRVDCVAFSPDGKRLATVDSPGVILCWDATTGRELQRLQWRTSRACSVAFSPDNRLLAVAFEDGSVRVCDAASGQVIQTLHGHSELVSGVTFSPDGKWLASTGWDNVVKLWDATSGQEIHTFQGSERLNESLAGFTSLTFSPDGKMLAAATFDGVVIVWDATSGQKMFVLVGHSRSVNSVTYSADGRRLATASDDRTVKVWESMNGQELLTLKGHTAEVTGVSFSPDGKRLASASYDGTVKVWGVLMHDAMVALETK